ALSLRLEVSHEPVCYPVWRSIYAGARLTIPLTASPTKMRTGSASISAGGVSRFLLPTFLCGGKEK
ncbi:hypothetical protein, partial [Paraburkholderia caribensis]|uniref:hypothetical protein n=1 Tax=Paraburkholderia caribensis TaxID=75105 RepID=UPI0031DDDC82